MAEYSKGQRQKITLFVSGFIMDLREYDHIISSPNTFPKSTLEYIRDILSNSKSSYSYLIDKVLSDGYIEPPSDYKWHGFYRITLPKEDMLLVLHDLEGIKRNLINKPVQSKIDIASVEQYIEYWRRAINEVPVPYEEAVKNQQYYDLRNATLDDFIRFIFDHDVPEDSRDREYWYYDYDMWIDYNRDELIDLYISLFNSSGDLINKYSYEQLDQGCWAMIGPNLDIGLEEMIWDTDIARAKRVLLIYSMYEIYKNLYTKIQIETSCNMWWDCLAYDFYDTELRNRHNEETRIIQDAMFCTLKKILELESEYCQEAALHGLGHLRHPETKIAIEAYLMKNSRLSKEQKKYAKACITGDIM